ncbi:MAG TPA: FAD-dependent oxidoreductase, partial [Candidatus Nitrosocosmicus sp.]|nr:FAD-dependent oxidoreductase [Candidatus Nitrosocosmicus sp.]
MNKGTLYDVIVIGTGTAGSTVASNCRSKGLKVAIIDSVPFGGTCALRGCEPKKILVEAAKTIDAIQRLENKSISDIDKVHLNWH